MWIVQWDGAAIMTTIKPFGASAFTEVDPEIMAQVLRDTDIARWRAAAVDMGYSPADANDIATGIVDKAARKRSTSTSQDATLEQKARDLLGRIGVPNPHDYTAGDLVELANLIDAAQTKNMTHGSP